MMPSQYANSYWRFPSYYLKFMWGCQGSKAVRYHTYKTLILVGTPCGPVQNPQKFCRTIGKDCPGRKTHSLHGGTNGVLPPLCHTPHAQPPALSQLLRPLSIYPKNSFSLLLAASPWVALAVYMLCLTEGRTTAFCSHHRAQHCAWHRKGGS